MVTFKDIESADTLTDDAYLLQIPKNGPSQNYPGMLFY
jgi:hypothetical protein